MQLGLPSGLLCAVWLCALAGSGLAFEYSEYCANMCMYGQGGNLCKCSAVHFAGKRIVVGARSAGSTLELDQEDMDRGLQQDDGQEEGQDGGDSLPLPVFPDGGDQLGRGNAVKSFLQKLSRMQDLNKQRMPQTGFGTDYTQAGLLSRVVQKYLQHKAAPVLAKRPWGASRAE